HLAETVKELVGISLEKGKIIHIDIEPEPDGMIDHVADTIDFYNHKLIPIVTAYLIDNLSVKHKTAEELAREHLQLCYDVCHFAVMYEDPAAAVEAFQEAGIGIGRVQISAALKADLPSDTESRNVVAQAFQNLAESTYLHQVSSRKFGFRTSDFGIAQYPDLLDALPHIHDPDAIEWRTHFHVPVFVKDFGVLQSTQEDILKIISLQKRKPFTRHLEVETYTWEVLPPDLKISLLESIEREMRWVLARISS
ncbi:MAG: metabolite traffic protein EboE, partial [Lactococcus garvieae]